MTGPITSGVALLVEDDPPLAKAMQHRLEALGFDVVRARRYDEGVLHLESRRPRVIFVELGLPDGSGYTFCEHVRSAPERCHVAVVLVSETASPLEMAQAEEAGADAYLQKPFSMARLETYVRAVLESEKESRPNVRVLNV